MKVMSADAPGARVLYAVVAGDPVEQGAGTVAWPLRPAEGAVTARPIGLLLDGLPDAVVAKGVSVSHAEDQARADSLCERRINRRLIKAHHRAQWA